MFFLEVFVGVVAAVLIEECDDAAQLGLPGVECGAGGGEVDEFGLDVDDFVDDAGVGGVDDGRGVVPADRSGG